MSVELIVDPGHGGKDPGGGSNQYWKEKDMVLDISLYQYNRFKELGVPVALTRDKDVYVSPEQRTKIVRDSGAKHCISNHINAGGGDGAETIHSIYSEGHLAKALAEAIFKAGQNIRRVFTRSLPYDSRKDYYFMHRDTGKVNTVIVEYGFADSKKDDIEQLKLDWKKYAEAVVEGYCKQTGRTYSPPRSDEEVAQFNPSSATVKTETKELLSKLHKVGILSDDWSAKIDELSDSDVIGLLVTAINRKKLLP
ncbi:N-acetylmuramoyl-L-alanine amidase [Bacillus oleivorans]|uniref:N-acetylmuramoyl-L-alanine amidase n=1 Tax=Bacillus oleivorans TaxID=1448271 RepID=A0A285CJX4_9BACI|nr:N-acetylmuramoyl-L-alanine amidase [Bacillus oleivorans]SNX67819.1 N-acetylmuramoyl-L-alanine amidase [Bacillus oleivorans]